MESKGYLAWSTIAALVLSTLFHRVLRLLKPGLVDADEGFEVMERYRGNEKVMDVK